MNRTLPALPLLCRRTRAQSWGVRSRRLIAAFGVVGLGLLRIAVPAVHANPFVTLEFVTFSGYNGIDFEQPLSVAIDPLRGEFALANSGHGRIEILRPDGRAAAFIEHLVKRPDGSLIPGRPQSVCYDAAGHLLVSDSLVPCVDVINFRGKVVGHLCLPADDAGAASDTAAGALARMRDGSILVASRGEPARIHHFDARGHWLGAWGRSGSGAGELSKITALAEAPSGDILVACDGTELVVQRFDSTGRFVAGFGRHELGPGNFSFPSGLAITDDGRIWVSDELRQTVQIFDHDGHFLGMAGQGGTDPGSFLYPSGVATDGRRRLAVVERVGARLQVFSLVNIQDAFSVAKRR